MTDVVRVDHDQLEKVTKTFGAQSSAVGQMNQQVVRAMQQLKSGWIGRGSDAFFAEMEGKVLPGVRRLVEALAEASRATRQISELIKTADEEASAGFRTGLSGGGAAGMGTGAGAGDAAGAISGAAADINSLLDGSAAAWNDVSVTGAAGDPFGNNFFTGDFLDGAPVNGDGMSVPGDWLNGVTESLHDHLNGQYDDHGIPRDWLDGVREAMGQEGAEGQSGGGGGSQSGGGSGGGEQSGGGGGGGEQPEQPTAQESGGGSGGGQSGGGSGGGQPSGGGGSPSESGLGEGALGGGSGGGMPGSPFGSPFGSDSPFGSEGFGRGAETGTTPAETARPLRFGFGGLGAGGSTSGGAGEVRIFTTMGESGSVPANPAANMGLPVGLAAAMPMLAVLGKAMRRRTVS